MERLIKVRFSGEREIYFQVFKFSSFYVSKDSGENQHLDPKKV